MNDLVEQSRRYSVLVVDDLSSNRMILERILQSVGYQVHSAQSGAEARMIAAEKRPDLILLDVMMPDEDGFETMEKLKRENSTAGIPVIFITALSEVEAKVRGFDLGAVDYIVKPYHAEEIKARVRLHLKLSVATGALIQAQAERLRQISHAQHDMLTRPSELPDAGAEVEYESLLEAGGDFYEIIKESKNVFGYFLADVAGHDLATSFVTASLKALLKQNCSPIYSPVESMRMINRVLVEILPEDKYLTAAYLRLNREYGKAYYVNMGHPQIVRAPMDEDPTLIEMKGDVIGAYHNVDIHECRMDVKLGERFYMYSDGILESEGRGPVWTGRTKELLDVVAATAGFKLPKAIKTIRQTLTDGRTINDDLVLMGIEV